MTLTFCFSFSVGRLYKCGQKYIVELLNEGRDFGRGYIVRYPGPYDKESEAARVQDSS